LLERITAYVFYCLLGIGLLFGCSGTSPDGDKDTDQEPGPGSSSTLHSFLSYKVTMWDASTDQDIIVGIKALSLDNLNESLEVDVSADGSLKILSNGFQAGIYDGTNYSIGSYHTSSVIYINEGKLKRLPVYQVDKPTAVQMSAESDGDLICRADLRRGNDYAQQKNSRLLYKKLSSVTEIQDCQLKEGRWYMVHAGDDENDIPVSLPQGLDFIVDAVHGSDDGSLVGWVVVENGQLRQYDTDFSFAQTINTNSGPIVVTEYARLLTRTATKQFLLDVDNKLYIYNPYNYEVLNQKASFSVLNNQRLGSYKVADGEKAFFSVEDLSTFDNSVTTSRLYSLTLASGESQLLVTVNNAVGKIVLTSDYVIYGVNATPKWPLGQRVKKVTKTGGASEDINAPENVDGVFDLYAAGEYFYVNHTIGDSQSVERIRQTEISGTIHGYHRIIGAIYGHTLNPAKYYLDIDYFVVIQNDPQFGTKRLHSINVATGEMSVLGELPTEAFLDSRFEFIEALGHSHALVGIYHQGLRDLYYFDATKENSLRRLGVHTPENENGIYYKSSNLQ